jgi:hypothetical protein
LHTHSLGSHRLQIIRAGVNPLSTQKRTSDCDDNVPQVTVAAEEYKLLRDVEQAAQSVGFAAANGSIEQLLGRISEMRDELMRLSVWRVKEPR